jgi:hypothetical protein
MFRLRAVVEKTVMPFLAATSSSRLGGERIYIFDETNFSPLPFLGARPNAHRASLAKITRAKFLHRYVVTLLRPDGSTIEVRHCEPRWADLSNFKFVLIPKNLTSKKKLMPGKGPYFSFRKEDLFYFKNKLFGK